MAKRTLADASYTDLDTAMSINRKILSCKSNHDEIYHVRADDHSVQTPPASTAIPAAVLISPPSPPTKIDPPSAPAAQVQQETIVTAEVLADEPITAKQILTFLIGYKLKRLPLELPESSTIKALVQGEYCASHPCFYG
jgi:3-oxoacyl-ACP reductase-like protein